MIYKYFELQGNEVNIIQSDFMHLQKKKIIQKKKNYKYVETLPYNKNLSIKRIKSHYKFARDSFRLIDDIEPNLVYVILPPNSLAKFASKYKKKNKETKLYFDIMDMWPESIPVKILKLFSLFTPWVKVRDNNLKYADCIITECELYQKILKKKINKMQKETLYLGKKESSIKCNEITSNKVINLCYLGSINNIIDIQLIKKFINVLNSMKKTIIHIIGDGENRNRFIEEIKRTGASVKFYGAVYDSNEKKKIFDNCHFGLNIMKQNVCVGLTMKSIDYFQFGIPIINNIKEDTTNIVEENKVGFNINKDNLLLIANKIANLEVDEINYLKKNTYKVFETNFSQQAFNNKLHFIMENN